MKNFFARRWRKIVLYVKLPEMWLFWFFLPFLIIFLIINYVYLPLAWFWINVAVSIILTAIILLNNLRLARSNLEVKIERNEMQSVILNLHDGIIVYDQEFKILIFNKAAEEIFGISAKEIVGKYFTLEDSKSQQFKLLSQVIFPSLAPSIVRRSEPGIYPQVIDIFFDTPQIDLRVSTDRIVDPHGQLLGFFKLVHDKSRERQLLRSKTEFITIAAHQLRTPSTSVHWALESLSNENLPANQKEMVNAGLGAAVNLLKTINDLLDVSKIEEGKFGYQFENINLVDFVGDIVAQAQYLSERFKIKIYYNKPKEEAIVVSVDPEKLTMVVSILLDNAVKYNVENGEVIVSLERLPDKPYVQISIKDTGIGISQDDINKLFVKFFRAENAVQNASDGTGLGLYIVKNIVQRHGGQVRVESEINRGSTFYFTLPTDPKLIPPKEIIYGED